MTPSDKYVTVQVELLDTDEVKEILRTLDAENKQLLAENARLRAVLTMCAEAGREAGEALVYRPEEPAHIDGEADG